MVMSLFCLTYILAKNISRMVPEQRWQHSGHGQAAFEINRIANVYLSPKYYSKKGHINA